jgi:hypothetical protein
MGRQTNKIALSEFVRIVGFHSFVQQFDCLFGHFSGPHGQNSSFSNKLTEG